MYRHLFVLTFLLVGCSGCEVDEDEAQSPTLHVPQITELTIAPDVATYMEGDGTVDIIAEIGFKDTGLDIQALWVRMPGGNSVELSESFATETGTFSQHIAVPTNQLGTISVEFWLVDQAGYRSNPVAAELRVVGDIQSGDWTNRLSGLENALSDVVWTGNVFVAVGGHGTVLSSADGIDWVARQSGTTADLSAIASYGSEIFAVGYETVLLSTDDGTSWTVMEMPADSALEAVAVNSSQVVIGGYRWGWGTAITLISEDHGATWQAVDSWPNESLHMSDIVYRDGLFVASTPSPWGLDARVAVSSDGKSWNEIAVSDESEWAVPHTIIHDGSQFILAGLAGTVFTSLDGFNWTRLQTPVQDVFYTGAARGGSKLVLAGPWTCGYLIGRCDSAFILPPVGLSTTDGGLTWEISNIDGDYESWGLAWGNGRFVSVGRKPAFSSQGAIYTAE